jgi:hypothetical protein
MFVVDSFQMTIKEVQLKEVVYRGECPQHLPRGRAKHGRGWVEMLINIVELENDCFKMY